MGDQGYDLSYDLGYIQLEPVCFSATPGRMTPAELEALFSREPASFVFADAPPIQGRARRIGTAPGMIMEIESNAVTLLGAFSSSNPDDAKRNAVLMQLLLAALRPDWARSELWLATQMRLAGRSEKPDFESPNYARKVRFVFHRQTGQAVLRVEMR